MAGPAGKERGFTLKVFLKIDTLIRRLIDTLTFHDVQRYKKIKGNF